MYGFGLRRAHSDQALHRGLLEDPERRAAPALVRAKIPGAPNSDDVVDPEEHMSIDVMAPSSVRRDQCAHISIAHHSSVYRSLPVNDHMTRLRYQSPGWLWLSLVPALSTAGR